MRTVVRGHALAPRIGAAVQWALYWVIKMGGVGLLGPLGLACVQVLAQISRGRPGNAIAARVFGR